MSARFAHVNLVARDLDRLVAFYVGVFGCVRGVERIYDTPERSEALRRGLGVAGLRLRGVHLLLPGHGDNGPSLELFQYAPPTERAPAPPQATGFGHVAFEVADMDATRAAVLRAGGTSVGELVTVPYPTGGTLTWCYVRDPEGNFVELQSRSA
jgi:catechol 2,3-dioxygenase-like lactoylglutathione lyase family enzyme